MVWSFRSNFRAGNAHSINNHVAHRMDLGDVVAICSRPYWSRLWIVQELLMASEIIVKCGNDEFTWNNFALFFRRLRGWSSSTHPVISPPLNSVPAMLSQHNTRNGEPGEIVGKKRPLLRPCWFLISAIRVID
jgi:hypothetical protein